MAWKKCTRASVSYLPSHTCSRVEGWHSARVCRFLGNIDSCNLYLKNRRRNSRKAVAGGLSLCFIDFIFACKWVDVLSAVQWLTPTRPRLDTSCSMMAVEHRTTTLKWTLKTNCDDIFGIWGYIHSDFYSLTWVTQKLLSNTVKGHLSPEYSI